MKNKIAVILASLLCFSSLALATDMDDIKNEISLVNKELSKANSDIQRKLLKMSVGYLEHKVKARVHSLEEKLNDYRDSLATIDERFPPEEDVEYKEATKKRIASSIAKVEYRLGVAKEILGEIQALKESI